MRSALLSAALLFVTGCATGAPVGGRQLFERYEPFARAAAPRQVPPATTPAAHAPLAVSPDARSRAVKTAVSLLGKHRVTVEGKRYGDDCTGFVRAVYEPLGVNLMAAGQKGDNGVTAMWRFASAHGQVFTGGRPVPGDLVFFKETYDLNRDGRVNDGLTHVGVVEDIERDGTVLIIHRVARGVVRYRMNLQHPTVQKTNGGRRLNDWLRTESAGSRPRLTAELFASYATLLPTDARVARR